jgi:hypothetical protein
VTTMRRWLSSAHQQLAKRIDAANHEAIARISKADIFLKDIRPAREVIPALADGKRKLVLLSGPPVTWQNMCNAQKGAVLGICMFEGWARTPEEARKLCADGKVEFEPNHHHGACGPMAGTITSSFPLFVLENRAFGNIALSRPADLAQQFGDYHNIQDIKWWRDGVAPHLGHALRTMGGIPLNKMMQESLDMGDEAHNRNNALAAMLSFELVQGLIEANVPKATILSIMRWFSYTTWATQSGVRALLGVVMPFSKAVLDPIAGIDYCTIVHCMSRNGSEFGIRVAATGDQWYTAPAPLPEGRFFGNYKQEDVGGDMGDSAITETAGFGAFVLEGAPAFARGLPANMDRLRSITRENANYMAGESPILTVATNDCKPLRVGIDVRKVVAQGVGPWIDTGITHKDEGHRVIGRGFVRAPLKCFQLAKAELERKFGSHI